MMGLGLFRHYKGGLYYVVGIAQLTENMEGLVLYCRQHERKLWARPYNNFKAHVWHHGQWVPRFAPEGDGDRCGKTTQ